MSEEIEPMYLYSVELGGCVRYWVAAESQHQAIDLLREEIEEIDSTDEILIKFVKTSEAMAIKVHCDEDVPHDLFLSDLFAKTQAPLILACSEW